MRDHPLSSFVVAKNEQKIGKALHIAAKENNAQGIRDFAANELKNIPLNQRLAWLRNQGADQAMHESMIRGSAEAIEAWATVIQLLPEKSRFAFLSEKIKERKTDHKDGNENFVSAIASGMTKKIAPTVVRITPKEWSLLDKAALSKVLEEAGLDLTQRFAERLMGKSSTLFFPAKKDNDDNDSVTSTEKLLFTGKMDIDVSYESSKNEDRHSIATSIFSNAQPGAMKAWGKLLALVPDQNKERSQLLFARMDHAAGTPALAYLFERGEKQALDQFVDLAKQHVWHGDDDIHHVLFDCMPTLKILTSGRGKVSGLEAQDWVRADGLKYTRPHGLSSNSQDIAKAYGTLMQLVPGKYRNDIFFPEEVWTNFTRRNLDSQQARELAHSITMLKAMVPTMNDEERKTVLNEIRSRHATKIMGVWKNTSSYEKFKKTWPAVDAMLLDLKAELKKVASH